MERLSFGFFLPAHLSPFPFEAVGTSQDTYALFLPQGRPSCSPEPSSWQWPAALSTQEQVAFRVCFSL